MGLISRFALAAFAATILAACATAPAPTQSTANSPFTHGNVQLNLVKNVTTQAQVLEVFGAPNVATVDAEGREVWTFQKNAQVSQSTSVDSFGTIILAGTSKTSTQFEQSSRTMTLIIKFDKEKKVVDFMSRTSSF